MSPAFSHAGDGALCGVLPHPERPAGGGLVLAVGGKPNVVRLQRRASHVEVLLPEIQAGVEHGVDAPVLHDAQAVGHKVGELALAEGGLISVLNVHGDGELEVPAAQRGAEERQLPVGFGAGDGLEIAIHAHRDAQPGPCCQSLLFRLVGQRHL